MKSYLQKEKISVELLLGLINDKKKQMNNTVQNRKYSEILKMVKKKVKRKNSVDKQEILVLKISYE